MKKYWLAITLVLFALLIVFLADSGNMPYAIRKLYDFPNGDKIGHFLLMGSINYVLIQTALASRADEKPAHVIWAVSITVAFFVTLEELSQYFFPTRTLSLLDLVFDYTGIAFFAYLASQKNNKPSGRDVA